MHIHSIVTSDYVQLGVIVSGLITLLMLAIQAYRYILLPLVSIMRNGFTKAAEIMRMARKREIEACASDLHQFVTSLGVRLVQMTFALGNLLMASLVTMVSAIMYVPGYGGGPGITLITLGMSPKTAAINASVFSLVATIFFFGASISTFRFLLNVAGRRRAAQQ